MLGHLVYSWLLFVCVTLSYLVLTKSTMVPLWVRCLDVACTRPVLTGVTGRIQGGPWQVWLALDGRRG